MSVRSEGSGPGSIGRLAGRVDAALFRPVDGASLVFFRVAFGLILLVESLRFIAHDWIHEEFLEPVFHFTYRGFGWVAPWPGDGLYWHFAGLALLAALIMLGAFYRLACLLFLVGFAYVFLLDQTLYLNHFVLVILLALLLCVVPANRDWSLDAALRPGFRRRSVPGWSVWLIRMQFEVMYLYAGIVKVNADWLRLEPMGMWLARRDYLPVVGPLLDTDWMAALTSYGSILLHLVGAPLLLFRRTRGYVVVVYLLFHLSNHVLFQIGIFPWLAIAGTLMFLSPDWPRRLVAGLADRIRSGPLAGREGSRG
ncbi:Vitamin K-dependent gamma-carboxylase [Tistlia consotensis]|uniref:Vitamin K-dependent gamma-carboxylase n=1 Tax=Tistlia consotensis USBA 355 TaxID=560819 RepID=A0A1Y6CPA2_9PROT|nr:HTTM domain-containing protein [Tistlia consotensis]SMF63298.1 Vitamin K-dependent gamma-carboxylase [Tistlia consotensis USBA 355]SNR95997.1 Vitamin K-dependent gamma-carboxylase [Tistlia consotensis]